MSDESNGVADDLQMPGSGWTARTGEGWPTHRHRARQRRQRRDRNGRKSHR